MQMVVSKTWLTASTSSRSLELVSMIPVLSSSESRGQVTGNCEI